MTAGDKALPAKDREPEVLIRERTVERVPDRFSGPWETEPEGLRCGWNLDLETADSQQVVYHRRKMPDETRDHNDLEVVMSRAGWDLLGRPSRISVTIDPLVHTVYRDRWQTWQGPAEDMPEDGPETQPSPEY